MRERGPAQRILLTARPESLVGLRPLATLTAANPAFYLTIASHEPPAPSTALLWRHMGMLPSSTLSH
jgi:hypothetical protein